MIMEKNRENRTIKNKITIFISSFWFKNSSKYNTFTPTNTPAIKNILVYAMKTTYDQKLSIQEAVYPIKWGLPNIPIKMP